jgi:hypothetical protein
VDVLMEMNWHRGAADGSRIRRLRAWSRSPGTPLNLLMELTPDGTDYRVIAEAPPEEDQAVLPEALRLLLDGAPHKLTRQEILDGWLPDFLPAPDGSTLTRWLLRAVAGGQVCRDGTGRRNHPFRYWLPEREAFMRPEGGSDEELLAWNARCLAELFGGQEQTSEAELPHEMTLRGNQDSTGASAATAAQAERTPIEPVPPPGSGPETTASASPAPAPRPSPLAQPVAPQAPVRLPYPFNLMNPSDVPEEVWKRARAGQQSTW